jgi:hypothetical protein
VKALVVSFCQMPRLMGTTKKQNKAETLHMRNYIWNYKYYIYIY